MRNKLSMIPRNMDDMCKTVQDLWDTVVNPQITISGGEPFTTPGEDLKRLFKLVETLQGRFGVITNGSLVTEDWIPFFRDNRGAITFSFDGPGMNGGRSSILDEEHVIDMMKKFLAGGVRVLTSIVLNDAHDHKKLIEWIKQLHTMGIDLGYVQGLRDPNINPDSTGRFWELLTDLVFDTDWCMYEPVVGVIDMFRSKVNRWCFRNPCDPYSTYNIIDVFGDGSYSSCIFTQMNNGTMMPMQERSFERCHALYWTPQSNGGCKDCKWWNCCYGGCPGNAQDPRKRDTSCGAYMMLFQKVWDRMMAKGMNPRMPDPVEWFDPHMQDVVYRRIPHATGKIQTTVVNKIRMVEYGNEIELFYDPKEMY
jgi:uncharacterized protein